MSVVVAIKDNDRILMACDSQVTAGYTKFTTIKQKKIWKPSDNQNIVMGLCGAFRDTNILSTGEKWIDELTELKNEVNFKYIVRNVVPKIFNELNTYGRICVKDSMKFLDSQIMFAYKDNCWIIEEDGCVLELEDDNILIIGSGTRLSQGTFNTIKNSNKTPKEKLIEVIKSACESDLYVNYPIVIMNTKNDKIEIIEKEK